MLFPILWYDAHAEGGIIHHDTFVIYHLVILIERDNKRYNLNPDVILRVFQVSMGGSHPQGFTVASLRGMHSTQFTHMAVSGEGPQYITQGSLAGEIGGERPRKPYKCTSCVVAFHSPAALRTHQMIHTGEKPFKCEYCSYATNRRYCLTTHVQRKHKLQPNSDGVESAENTMVDWIADL